MALVQTTDHAAEAIALLLEQLKGKLAMGDLVSALVSPLDALEADAFSLRNERIDIDAAEGVQLEGIGDLMDCARAGRSDADYRIAIRAEIALHGATGAGDNLIDITGGRVFLREYEFGDAEFEARGRDPETEALLPTIFDAEADEIFRLLNRGRSGAVYFVFLWGHFDEDSAGDEFAFDLPPGDAGGFDGVDGAGLFRIGSRGADPLTE